MMNFPETMASTYKVLSYLILTLAAAIILVVLAIFLYFKFGGSNNFAEFRFEKLDNKVVVHKTLNSSIVKPNDTVYYITLSSDVNIDSLYKRRKAVNLYMICPTEADNTNSVIYPEIYPRIYGSSWFWNQYGNNESKKVDGRYFYTFEMSFEDTSGRTDNIVNIMNNRTECLSCRVFLVYYFSRPNDKSAIFCIPPLAQ